MEEEEKNSLDISELGLIQKEILHFLAERPDFKPKDLYERAGISRSNFFRVMHGKFREVRPGDWAKWRKCLKVSRGEFWKRARDHFDPD